MSKIFKTEAVAQADSFNPDKPSPPCTIWNNWEGEGFHQRCTQCRPTPCLVHGSVGLYLPMSMVCAAHQGYCSGDQAKDLLTLLQLVWSPAPLKSAAFSETMGLIHFYPFNGNSSNTVPCCISSSLSFTPLLSSYCRCYLFPRAHGFFFTTVIAVPGTTLPCDPVSNVKLINVPVIFWPINHSLSSATLSIAPMKNSSELIVLLSSFSSILCALCWCSCRLSATKT